MTTQTFSEWLSRHGCTTHELWKLQNMLGSCLGYDHPLHLEAVKAWESREDADTDYGFSKA